MLSLLLYRFLFPFRFLFRFRFLFLFVFPFLFRIPDSGFPLFQTPNAESTRKSCPDLTLFIRPLEEQERELHETFYFARASKNVMNMARHFNHRRTIVNDRLSAAALIAFSLLKVRRLFRNGA